MPKIVGLGLILLIGLNSFAQVNSQDDEADGFSDSYEPFSTHHDMYGDMDIDHRIGGANQEEKAVAGKSDASDQKPAESLLSMSMDPMSDGISGDPDIKKVLADVEAQDEINTSATSHRVPHQLNLAVGSSSSYTAPIQQLQYTQQPLQGPPPPPQSTLSEEHRQAIQQLALQQQHAIAQLASEQRVLEQQRLEQEAVQYHQQAQQQFVQQFQQPTPTAQVQQQIYNQPAAVAPQLVQHQHVQQQQVQPALPQFAQPSPAAPQLIQYQQQPTDSPPQQLIQQHYPSPSAAPQLLSQAVGFGQQPVQQVLHQAQPAHQVFQGPTQAKPIQLQQHVYQSPSQVPVLQHQQPQIFQGPGPSQAPHLQVQQQQQIFEGLGPSQASPVHVQHQQQLQQVFQSPGSSPASPVHVQQQPQQLLFQSSSPSPPQVLHQQQVYQGQQQQQQPSPVPVAQPPLHVVHTPLPSSLPVQHPQQQIYATGPSQQPPVQQQQVQQVYQQQQPIVPQYQQAPIQYQIPTTGPTPAAPAQVQPQQFIYHSPSPAPQQQQPQQELQFQLTAQQQQQQLVPTHSQQQAQQQQVQIQQQVQQPFQAGTPLTIEQYHRQVSPAPGQQVQVQQQQHQAQLDNTLALGSEQSAAVSTASSPQQDQPKPSPPQNIQQILLQQNQPETSDESSDYQQEQQPQQSPPETSTRYPQTYDIQAEYERAINSTQSQSPFSQQDLLDASQELNQYAQSIEERAAQILENFRRQVLGVNQKKETTTQDPPTTTTTVPQEVQSNPTAQEQFSGGILQALLPPAPFPTVEQQPQQEQQQQTQEPTPQNQGQEPMQNQQQEQPNQQAQQAQSESDRAQTLENEIIQEGSASIQNQIVHSQNNLQYPGNQFGGGIQQPVPQQQQSQSQPQQEQGPPEIGNSPASPMQQTQAVIQQVIETQAIQQNSLQQLWQLYQQQALQQQQLIQQQELQRQAAQVPVIAPQSPYQLLPQAAPVAAPVPVIPKRRVPASSYPQLPGPVLLPSQPEGPVYYQQFIGPVPTELRKPAQPESSPFTSVHDNSHYTIYKVKDDHDYRGLSGLLPEDQQIKIETSQPLAQPVPQYNAYNPYQVQPQRQVLPEPAPPQIPAGGELVPLEEVGRKEEAHAFLQLPTHTHDPAPGPGPTQAPHTTLPVPQQQQQPYYPLTAFSQQQSQVAQAQNVNSGGSDFYQVKSHSYVMPPQQTYTYPQGQAPSFVQQPSHQIQIQPQQFESVPAFSEENPSYQQHHYAGTTYHQHHSYAPQLGSSPVKQSKKHHHQKISYPKPVVTSLSKPSKRLRNKSQYSVVANMEYRPDIMLPADEASFAAHQAKVLGGPAFRDEGYNEQGRAQPAVLNVNVNPTAAAESFGLTLQPLLRLGKISANAFKEGFNQRMHKLHQVAAHRRNTNANGNTNTQVNVNAQAQERSDDELERQQIAQEASALSPTIAIALPSSRRKLSRNSNKMTSLIAHLEQAFSPRAGDLEGIESAAAAAAVAEPIAVTAPATATARAHKKSRKSAAYRERQAVLADLLKATSEADGLELVPPAPAPAS